MGWFASEMHYGGPVRIARPRSRRATRCGSLPLRVCSSRSNPNRAAHVTTESVPASTDGTARAAHSNLLAIVEKLSLVTANGGRYFPPRQGELWDGVGVALSLVHETWHL